MKRGSGYFLVLILGLVLMFLLNCYLFRQNSHYRSLNRELILENDSLIAVTIKLKRQIPVPERATVSNESQCRIKD